MPEKKKDPNLTSEEKMSELKSSSDVDSSEELKDNLSQEDIGEFDELRRTFLTPEAIKRLTEWMSKIDFSNYDSWVPDDLSEIMTPEEIEEFHTVKRIFLTPENVKMMRERMEKRRNAKEGNKPEKKKDSFLTFDELISDFEFASDVYTSEELKDYLSQEDIDEVDNYIEEYHKDEEGTT